MKKWLIALLVALPLCADAQLDTTKWYPVTYAYGSNTWCFNSSQVGVSGGLLLETALFGTDTCGVGAGNYRGAMIITAPFYFDYGRVVVRGQVAGLGVHSTAPWLWGGTVASSGYPPTCIAALKAGGAPMAACATAAHEIDACEYQPNVNPTTKVANNFNTWLAGVLTNAYSHVTTFGGDASTSMNTCEVDLAPAGVTYRMNGVQVGSFSVSMAGYFWFMLIDQEFDSSAPPETSGFYPQVAKFQYAEVICTSDTTVPTCTPGQVIFIDNFTAGTGAAQSQGVNKGVLQ